MMPAYMRSCLSKLVRTRIEGKKPAVDHGAWLRGVQDWPEACRSRLSDALRENHESGN